MHYKEDLTVKKVEDAEIEKNDDSGLTHKRTLVLENDLTTISVKGDPKSIPRFKPGEKIQVMLLNPQTQLSSEEPEIDFSVEEQELLSEEIMEK